MRPLLSRSNFVIGTIALAANRAVSAAEETIAGELRRLTPPGNGDNRATFMQNSKDVLFASMRSGKSQIWTMPIEGGSPRRIHESSANDYGRVASNPDGRMLCFSSDRGGENAVYVFDLASASVTPISDLRWWSFGPSWSSANIIAYFSRKGGNQTNLWTVSPDGMQARQVTDSPGNSRQPWWSPDGETLAYAADGGTRTYHVSLTSANGSGSCEITRHGNCRQPVWNPEGTRLAVAAKGRSGFSRILIVELSNGTSRFIDQPGDANNVHPAWSPDGHNIVFTSGRGEGSALWRFRFAS